MGKIFVDSSVLFAGIMSRTGYAHALLQRGRSEIHIVCSSAVLGEVERNLCRKYSAILADFTRFIDADILDVVDPSDSLTTECAQLVHPKDAPIVAAAIYSQSQWIATYDQKHLLSARAAIQTHCNITTARPNEILKALGLRSTP